MSDLITIVGEDRKHTGKCNARKLRAKGLIPANLMEKSTAKNLAIDPKWLSKVWKSGKVFNLEWGGTVKPVKIHELQIHPVKRTALHVDLMYV